MSQKRKLPNSAADNATDIDVFRSTPIEDRSSTFVGLFSPTRTATQLQDLPEVKNASHRMYAWRKPSSQRTISGSKPNYDTGYDDDGEKYGGKRIEKVLDLMKVSGACVVARWYGGVMLGPVRFNHIEDVARAAVSQWQLHEQEQVVKKRKVMDEAEEQTRLAKSLGERDRSIEVLRALAAEKEVKVKGAIVAGVETLTGESSGQEVPTTASKEPVVAAPKPTMDYSTMPLDRLRGLDKARDATISFLLKRIDKAEADLKALAEPKEPP